MTLPVTGTRYERAAGLDIPDGKERDLLLLLAGFRDAGEKQPPIATLAAVLGVTIPEVDVLLDRLIWRGVLYVRWARRDGLHGRPGERASRGPVRRNSYKLLLPGDRNRRGLVDAASSDYSRSKFRPMASALHDLKGRTEREVFALVRAHRFRKAVEAVRLLDRLDELLAAPAAASVERRAKVSAERGGKYRRRP